MQFKPLGYRVFAKRLWDDCVGRIIKPDQNKKICREAVIVEKGQDVDTVKVGDHIIIGQYGQYEPPKFETDTNGKYKDCLIVNESEILGKIVGGKNGNSN